MPDRLSTTMLMFSTIVQTVDDMALGYDRPSRRTLFSTVFHILLLTTAACSRGDRSTHSDSTASSSFRVALLTPGPISDKSWNAGAYQGLLRIRDSLHASISHVQTKTPAEFDENFRQYGAQGYALVFGHGFEYQDAAQRVAPEYPRTVYALVSAKTVRPNVASIQFSFAEPSYLAGILAGAMTRTNVVGTIGGTELPPVRESFTAFAAGARASNPKVRVLSSYIGNWDDVGAGKEQALAQIAQRADVIFQNADAAGLGVFQAARENGHVYVIGSNSNQNDVAPTVTLGSVVIDLPHAYLLVARDVARGGFTGKLFDLGMRDDVLRLELNPALEGAIPPAVHARLDSVTKEVEAGRIVVPK
jgi:basic membrane lipoprotein Med (substrate-binding protein (PBP1-ABC) superfamily)